MRTRPAPEISDCLPVWLACCCLLACFARSSEGRAGLAGWLACCLLSWTGWASQAHMLMLAHVVASSQSESIVLRGFLVVYVAMPAPRPSSQAADLRRNARERPPPLGAPEGCSATVRLRSVGGVKVGCTHPVCLAEWWSRLPNTRSSACSITPSVSGSTALRAGFGERDPPGES